MVMFAGRCRRRAFVERAGPWLTTARALAPRAAREVRCPGYRRGDTRQRWSPYKASNPSWPFKPPMLAQEPPALGARRGISPRETNQCRPPLETALRWLFARTGARRERPAAGSQLPRDPRLLLWCSTTPLNTSAQRDTNRALNRLTERPS